jgi:hypothetical protein
MIVTQWAPLLAAGVGLALRLGGERLRRPAASFAAGGVALVVGWAVLQGAGAVRTLVLFAVAAVAVAALGVTAAPTGKRRSKAAPPRGASAERWVWLALLAGGGGWWLAPGPSPGVVAIAAGAVAIGLSGGLAEDVWAVAAAAGTLAAAVLAVDGGWGLAAPALVAAGACLGAGALAPLAAGLGGAAAMILQAALARGRHGAPLALAVLAPLGCLLLLLWWRGRFIRFGPAAGPVRAGVAAALVCLAVFSAAAMAGLR